MSKDKTHPCKNYHHTSRYDKSYIVRFPDIVGEVPHFVRANNHSQAALAAARMIQLGRFHELTKAHVILADNFNYDSVSLVMVKCEHRIMYSTV